MRASTPTLLAGSALFALTLASAAAAQDAAPAAAPTQLAMAESAAAPAAGAEEQPKEIVVLGFGRARQVQSVSAVDIARLTPGTSPLKAIAKLPGVQFQSADPFGAYEWAVRISLRGFNQNQLGFTLDDVPLGDMSYGNLNGLHISRAIISENIGRTEVAQGAGALGTASTSNLGGTIQFFSDTPRDVMDWAASGTGGADSTYRGYVRFDTGDIAGTGVKAYLSYANSHTDKWKGDGPQKQQQANGKVVASLGDLGSISAFFNWSQRRETDYQDLTLDLIHRLGKDAAYRIDNVKPNYQLAQQLAYDYQHGLAFPSPYQNVDDAYYDAGGLRNDILTGATFDAHLAPGITFKTTGYYHHNKGQGTWITPYTATPAGALDNNGNVITNPADLSYRTTEYSINRGGVVSNLKWEQGPNTLEVGGWYESNHFDQARRYYGLSATSYNRDTLSFQNNPFYTQFAGVFDTTTAQYHVSDSLKLLDDKLVVNFGWKGVNVTNQAHVTVGTLASGKIHTRDWFQPQAGILFHATPDLEAFADYAENMQAFQSALTSGPFSTTQAGFNAIKNTLKPETSKTYEGGLRFRHGPLQLSAVGYYIDFQNRLLQFNPCPAIESCPSTLNNVGAVHAYGAELSANYRIFGPLSVFANYSYNHSKYQDNVVLTDGTTYAFTKGKYVVDTPQHMVKGEIVYDDSRIFGRVGADYMAKRYFSYENDLVAGGRVTVDASLGYRFTVGRLKGFAIEANVTNLTDKKYISTVGDGGSFQVRSYTAPIPQGDADNPNIMVGAPRQWFITLKKDL